MMTRTKMTRMYVAHAFRYRRSTPSTARSTLKKVSENAFIQFTGLAMMPFGAHELGVKYLMGDPEGKKQRDLMERHIMLVGETRQLIRMNKQILVAIYAALKPALSLATAAAAHATPASASPATNASTVAAPAPPTPATPAPPTPATPATPAGA